MGYRGILLTRWSRRDWLAILVVAVTVAFLTGTTLLLVAAGDQTTEIAANNDSPGSATYYDDPEAARDAAGADRAVLPVAEVTNGSDRTLLVGVPDGLDVGTGGADAPFRSASGNATTLGTIGTPRTEQLSGPTGTVTVTVRPRDPTSVLAPPWYATDVDTVERVGVSGAFVVRTGPDAPASDGAGAVPFVSVLRFFVVGTNQALRAFAAVATGAATLVGVTVYSVSRMGVRDRLPTIQIVRATGGRPRTVLGLFALRAVLLTVVGTALGYAMGVIVTKGAVNLAVAIGLPTSLSIEAGGRVIGVLGFLYVLVVGVGGLAGAIAAWPAAEHPPGRLTEIGRSARPSSVVPELLVPSLLSWRALVPTTATLTTFVAFVVLVASMATIAGPLTTAEGATITQPGSSNPITSRVPATYADALHSRDIDASAEILLFEVIDDEPLLARGVAYGNFANVTDARLVRGRPPADRSEAVIGVDLARARGIDVGETLTLGGSTRPGLTRVEIVGTFSAPGPFDDQLLVTLPTARHLAGLGPGEVHMVRADRLPTGADDGRANGTGVGVGVVGLSVDDPVTANASFTAEVTLRNEGLRTASATLPVTFVDQRRTVSVQLRRGRQQTVRTEFTAGSPGTYTLEAGNATVRVQVVDPGSLAIDGVPTRAPPGSEPLVTVTRGTGAPAAGVNVTVGNRTVTTDGDGRVRVPLRASGRVEITARDRNDSTTRVVTVTPAAARNLTTEVRVRPNQPSLTTRPEARAVLTNPWAEPVNATVRLEGPGSTLERAVTVGPGERAVVTSRLARRPPGAYDVRVRVDDRVVGRVEYRVTGDRRIASALATSGGGGTTGISQSIEVLFGNFQILLAALLGLAALMTIGGTTATFAQAVYARRRTIGVHRATGAPPSRVVRLVLADAARIGAVASVAALGLALLAMQGLAAAGYLTVFGVTLQPVPSPILLVGVLVGALCVTLLGAALTTLALIRDSPASLLAGASERFQPRTDDEVSANE